VKVRDMFRGAINAEVLLLLLFTAAGFSKRFFNHCNPK